MRKGISRPLLKITIIAANVKSRKERAPSKLNGWNDGMLGFCSNILRKDMIYETIALLWIEEISIEGIKS
jgi:hypothetical protein